MGFQLAVHFSTINWISKGEVCIGGVLGQSVPFLIAQKGIGEFPKGITQGTQVQHALYLGEAEQA